MDTEEYVFGVVVVGRGLRYARLIFNHYLCVAIYWRRAAVWVNWSLFKVHARRLSLSSAEVTVIKESAIIGRGRKLAPERCDKVMLVGISCV